MHLHRSADDVGRRLRRRGYVAMGVRVKLKTTDFRLLTRQRRLPRSTDVAATLHAAALTLLDEFDDAGPFRLVGLAAYDLVRDVEDAQLDIFADGQRAAQARNDDRYADGAVRARHCASRERSQRQCDPGDRAESRFSRRRRERRDDDIN